MSRHFSLIICAFFTAMLVTCSAGAPVFPLQSEATGTATSLAPHDSADPATPTTAEPARDLSPAEVQILHFQVTPMVTNQIGDTLSIAWMAEGERAELCWLNGAGPTTCQPVPLTGSTTLIVDEQVLSMTGVGLRATVGDEFVWATTNLAIQCLGYRDWFFAEPPRRCPTAEAQVSPAAAQFFEHGFMIWTETPDTFYVFFEEQERARGKRFLRFAAPYSFGPELPLPETPPARLLAPVSGFGRLWRGELDVPYDDDLRTHLGWAVGPEFSFESVQQCEISGHPRGWTCYLQIPDGRVLRLWPDSTAQVHLLWRDVAAAEQPASPLAAPPGPDEPSIEPSVEPFVSPLPTATTSTAPEFLTCAQDGDVTRCHDALLDLTFDYPDFMGSIVATELRPGGYAGTFYEYDITDREHGVGVGGRSRDFSEGRGGFPTDQTGFGGRTTRQICADGSAQICQVVRPGVAFTVWLPEAEWLCGGGIASSFTPRMLIRLNLPDHPLVHGFGFAAHLLPHDMDAAARAAWEGDAIEERCTVAGHAAFDAARAELQLALENGTADPVIQARYDGLKDLAHSIQGPYVGE